MLFLDIKKYRNDKFAHIHCGFSERLQNCTTLSNELFLSDFHKRSG